MNDSQHAILQWTGHPLVDVGVATLCAMGGKPAPDELKLDDLDTAADELHEAYDSPMLVAYLSCVYTMNAAYTNPTMGGVQRKQEIDRVLRAHRSAPDPEAEGLRCVFSGQPATHLIHRAQMPMLTGAGVLNFFPAARSALPINGPYLVAMQALAMGGRRTEGKLLIVHCDDPRWTLDFARRYLQDNRRVLDLARRDELPEFEGPSPELQREWAAWDKSKKRSKYPDAKAPRSFVMQDLLDVVNRRSQGRLGQSHTSVTVYVMSNSGQGPSLAIEHIPSEFVAFLQQASQAPYQAAWRELVHRSWHSVQEGSGKASSAKKSGKSKNEIRPSVPGGPGRSRNDLYNDLLPVFDTGQKDMRAARYFLRRHLLRDPVGWLQKQQREAPRLRREDLQLIHWDLTALFMEKVIGMDNQRIQRICDFADKLAQVIFKQRDQKLFRELVYQDKPWQYRNALIKAQRNYARANQQLLFGLEEYLEVFLADDAVGASDWRLIRDLISIRLVEQLFELKFFNQEDASDLLDADEEDRLPAGAEPQSE